VSVRTILVPVTGLAETSSALEAGLRLGSRLGAHVEAVHVALDPRESVAFLGEGMTGAMIEEIMSLTEREAEQRGARARALFDELGRAHAPPIVEAGAAVEGFSAAYVSLTGREEEHIALRGRLADLIVLGQPAKGEEAPPPVTLEAALRETGRPVLVVPRGAGELGEKCAAIAWNGSAEAGRAIAAALPILAAIGRVEVFSIGEEGKWGGDIEDVVAYLAWHGVAASGQALDASPRSVGVSLLNAVDSAGAELLVMGAYTHSRLHRLIFGGVTREVLSSATIPVLMAH
jgi:nucleotide-binding universal stress UspA family protein